MSDEPRAKRAASRGAKRAAAVEAGGRVTRLPVVPAGVDDVAPPGAGRLAGGAVAGRGRSNGKPTAAARARSAGEGPRARRPSAKECRSTRRTVCGGCPQAEWCSAVGIGLEGCALESDPFRELNAPERLPGLLADILRAELRTFFRAKRQEAAGRAIDGEASKLAQALFKEVESYLGIVERLGTKVPGGAAASRPLEVFPSLAAALAASGDGLFSEVGDGVLRDRLRSAYIQAVEAEDAVLKRALAAVRGGNAGA